jgi:hypothetical protein
VMPPGFVFARRLTPTLRVCLSLSAVVLAGSVTLGACGGGSSAVPGSTTSPTKGAAGTGSSFSAYSTCMKQHGVSFGSFGGRRTGGSFPSGGGFSGGGFSGAGAGGFNSSAFAKASAACASLRPAGGFGSRPGGGFSGTALNAYRSCLASHGVTLPSRSATSSAPSTTLNTSSPCQKGPCRVRKSPL